MYKYHKLQSPLCRAVSPPKAGTFSRLKNSQQYTLVELRQFELKLTLLRHNRRYRNESISVNAISSKTVN
jgi:hypothetical protein